MNLATWTNYCQGGIMVGFRYDPDCTVSYPSYECPRCGGYWDGCGRAQHRPGCSEKGYDNAIVVFGPKQVQVAKEIAFEEDNENATWYGLSVSILRETYPELVEGFSL